MGWWRVLLILVNLDILKTSDKMIMFGFKREKNMLSPSPCSSSLSVFVCVRALAMP